MSRQYKYDVFISHALEDQKTIAAPLCESLREAGIKVWFSGQNLALGHKLSGTISDAISKSMFGIIIISHDYFISDWGKRELYQLLALENSGRHIILPIWHKVEGTDIKLNFPAIYDRFALRSDKGIPYLTQEIKKIIGEEELKQNLKQEFTLQQNKHVPAIASNGKTSLVPNNNTNTINIKVEQRKEKRASPKQEWLHWLVKVIIGALIILISIVIVSTLMNTLNKKAQLQPSNTENIIQV